MTIKSTSFVSFSNYCVNHRNCTQHLRSLTEKKSEIKYGKYLEYDLKQNKKKLKTPQMFHCYLVQFRILTPKLENETKLVNLLFQ